MLGKLFAAELKAIEAEIIREATVVASSLSALPDFAGSRWWGFPIYRPAN